MESRCYYDVEDTETGWPKQKWTLTEAKGQEGQGDLHAFLLCPGGGE